MVTEEGTGEGWESPASERRRRFLPSSRPVKKYLQDTRAPDHRAAAEVDPRRVVSLQVACRTPVNARLETCAA